MDFKGFDELIKELEQLGRKGSRIENKSLKAGAQPILNEAKNSSAFKDRSGKLRKGLTVGRPRIKNGSKYVLIGIDKGDISEIYYGKFLEFGTSKMQARPFLGPAFEMKKSEAMNIMQKEIKEGLGL